jgi:hypothetical protein
MKDIMQSVLISPFLLKLSLILASPIIFITTIYLYIVPNVFKVCTSPSLHVRLNFSMIFVQPKI